MQLLLQGDNSLRIKKYKSLTYKSEQTNAEDYINTRTEFGL